MAFKGPYKGVLELELHKLEFHVSFILFFFFLSLITLYLWWRFKDPTVTLKLDFEKIEFQIKDISLISLENGVKC